VICTCTCGRGDRLPGKEKKEREDWTPDDGGKPFKKRKRGLMVCVSSPPDLLHTVGKKKKREMGSQGLHMSNMGKGKRKMMTLAFIAGRRKRGEKRNSCTCIKREGKGFSPR